MRAATRDALLYERQVVEQKLKANRRLARQALGYERKLTDTQVKDAIQVRDATIKYERKLTDAGFATQRALGKAHTQFHKREHALNEAAIAKASTTITHQFEALQTDFERVRDALPGYMTTERFERDHKTLVDSIGLKFETYDKQIGAEEKVTIQQATREETLNLIRANTVQNRTTMIALLGLAVATLGHILKFF